MFLLDNKALETLVTILGNLGLYKGEHPISWHCKSRSSRSCLVLILIQEINIKIKKYWRHYKIRNHIIMLENLRSMRKNMINSWENYQKNAYLAKNNLNHPELWALLKAPPKNQEWNKIKNQEIKICKNTQATSFLQWFIQPKI